MVNVPKHQFGRNGPQVSAIGFGAMGLSIAYGKGPGEKGSLEVLDRVFEQGINHLDTSDIYGDCEDIIGKWFKQNPSNREKVFLATKFGIVFDGKSFAVKGDREYVRKAIDSSLKRLGVDYVDLYYFHRMDQNNPIEDTMEALAEIVKEGKIKYIGLSECSADTIRRAHKIHPVTAVQMEYSPFALDIESDQIGVLKTCRELGIAIVAYSPLSRGILTGQIKSRDDFEEGDFRLISPRFSEENFPKNLKLVEQIENFAKKKNCTPGQLTLAWILAQGDDFFPIPGTKKIKYLDENAAAANVKLSKDEVAELRKMIEAIQPAGERYPEGLTQSLFADTPKRS